MKDSKALEAIQNLEAISSTITKYSPLPTVTLLQKATNEMKDGVVTKPRKPPEEIVKKWKTALANQNFNLTRSEMKGLTWEPDIALSKIFIDQLLKTDLRGKGALKGFVYSFTSRWDKKNDPEVLEVIAKIRANFKHPYTTTLEKYIFDPGGVERFGTQFVETRGNISEQFMATFGVAVSNTLFGASVLEAVANTKYMTALDTDPNKKDWFYKEVLRLIPKSILMQALEKIIKEIDKSKNDTAKEELKHFVLHHPNLGDPRLPGKEGNWDKDAFVTKAVIEWLSATDIEIFFKIFFEEESDRQGRKAFWLPFAHQVKGTRVVVSDEDNRKWHSILKELRDPNSKKFGVVNTRMFAQFDNVYQKDTAFILDFGSVQVVEFSKPGNACFIYDDVMQFPYLDRNKFWETTQFSMAILKNQTSFKGRIIHGKGWQGKFENELSKLGIRPKVRK